MKNKPPRLVPCSKEGYKWMLVVYQGQARSRLYFQKKSDAERELSKLLKERARLPATEDPLSAEERDAVLQARKLGVDLGAAVDLYFKTWQARSKASTLEALISSRIGELNQAKVSGDYLKNLGLFFERVSAAWGPETNVADITAPQCSKFLLSQNWGNVSLHYYRSLLIGLFEHGVKNELCASNPAKLVSLPKSTAPPVSILTPQECLEFLRSCDRSILPGVILAMFAGLRPESEVQRLDWSSVKLARGFVEILPTKTKTAMRRLVTVQAPLRSWLLFWSGGAELPASGPVWPSEATVRRRLREARARCGWGSKTKPWPQDVLRHSFASYHLAFWNDAAKTAAELGHMTTKKLFANYREVVTSEDAAEFWGLRPLSVLPGKAIA